MSRSVSAQITPHPLFTATINNATYNATNNKVNHKAGCREHINNIFLKSEALRFNDKTQQTRCSVEVFRNSFNRKAYHLRDGPFETFTCSHNVKKKEISLSLCGGKEWTRLKQLRWCCWAVYVHKLRSRPEVWWAMKGSESLCFCFCNSFWTGWCHFVSTVFIFLCFISLYPPVQGRSPR